MNNHKHIPERSLFYAGGWQNVCKICGYVEMMLQADVGHGIVLPFWYPIWYWDQHLEFNK